MNHLAHTGSILLAAIGGTVVARTLAHGLFRGIRSAAASSLPPSLRHNFEAPTSTRDRGAAPARFIATGGEFYMDQIEMEWP